MVKTVREVCDYSGMDPRKNKIKGELINLHLKNENEMPEMWCSRIRASTKKILEENPDLLSKNQYIRMLVKSYYDGELSQCRKETN
jgi:hypothetical protein